MLLKTLRSINFIILLLNKFRVSLMNFTIKRFPQFSLLLYTLKILTKLILEIKIFFSAIFGVVWFWIPQVAAECQSKIMLHYICAFCMIVEQL